MKIKINKIQLIKWSKVNEAIIERKVDYKSILQIEFKQKILINQLKCLAIQEILLVHLN